MLTVCMWSYQHAYLCLLVCMWSYQHAYLCLLYVCGVTNMHTYAYCNVCGVSNIHTYVYCMYVELPTCIPMFTVCMWSYQHAYLCLLYVCEVSNMHTTIYNIMILQMFVLTNTKRSIYHSHNVSGMFIH